jgi:hypothetical protein
MLLICDEAREVRELLVEFVLELIIKGVEFIIGILATSHLFSLHYHLGLERLIFLENILARKLVIIKYISEILDDTKEPLEILSSHNIISLYALVLLDLLDVVLVLRLQLLQLLELLVQFTDALLIQVLLKVLVDLVPLVLI